METYSKRQLAATVKAINGLRKKNNLGRVKAKPPRQEVIITAEIREAVYMQAVAEIMPELFEKPVVYLPEDKKVALTSAFKQRIDEVRKGKREVPQVASS